MKNTIQLLFSFLFITINIFSALEENIDDDMEFYDLFLELPEVSIASKKDESLIGAAGTVYVISEQDIKRYGWRDMKEILAAIPNMDLLWQWNWLNGGQRGFTGNFSGTLLMIDGREVQNLLASEAFMKNNFPAHRIKRVEVLQGPNSTLYGGNATQGVINIITKIGDQGDKNITETSIIFGEADTYEITGLFKQKNENSEIGFSASWFRSRQDWTELADFAANDNLYSRQPDIDPFRYKGSTDFKLPEENWTADMYVRLKNLYFGANFFKAINIQGLEYVHMDYNINESRRGYFQPYVGYKQQFSEKFSAYAEFQYVVEDESWLKDSAINKDLWTSYDDIQIQLVGESFEKSTRNRLIFQGYYQLNDNNHIIFGYDWWKTEIDDYLTQAGKLIPNKSISNIPSGWPINLSTSEKHSVYFQDVISLLSDKLKITLGIRYNKQDHTNDSWLPRSSFVYQPDTNKAFKLTYGKSFRPPNIFEFNGTSDSEIDSQEVEMIEFNYSQNFDLDSLKIQNSFSIYTMENTNLYTQVYDPYSSGSGHFAGWTTIVGGSFKVNGLENLLRFSYQRLSGFFSFRFIEPDEYSVNDEKIVKDVPEYKLKLGLSYKLSEKIESSLFIDHWDDVNTESNTVDGLRTEVYTIDSWTQADLNINLGPYVVDDIEASLNFNIKNIFDEEIFHANARGATPVQFLQYPRSYRVKVSVKY